MNRGRVLGIDTSCYTTSLALVEGEVLLADHRRMLPVDDGARGLRQSEGFYHHHRHLPELLEQLMQGFPQGLALEAVAYAAAPRRVEGSYMPVFTAGEDFAKTLASVLRVPLIPLTHQEGHVQAALWDSGFSDEQPFLAVHLSGGTTEVLRIERDGSRYTAEILGGSLDISAGMLLDRLGVSLGFPFPAGRAMDELALTGKPPEKPFPVSARDGWMNLSGLENYTQSFLAGGGSRESAAAGVLSAVCRSLGKVLEHAVAESGTDRILFSGGVSSSQTLRAFLREHKRYSRLKTAFCAPVYSVDNAVGIALLGAKAAKHSWGQERLRIHPEDQETER